MANAAVASENESMPASPVDSDGGRASVTAVVSGIVGYTRWPAPATTATPTTIRMCVAGDGPGADELTRRADFASSKGGARTRPLSNPGEAADQCDAIYVGRLAAGAARDILQRTVGRPVLTIGEGAEFCSDGGMFCVLNDPASARFAVNLDAVARSGLRVNPWVLKIAKAPQQTASKK